MEGFISRESKARISFPLQGSQIMQQRRILRNLFALDILHHRTFCPLSQREYLLCILRIFEFPGMQSCELKMCIRDRL